MKQTALLLTLTAAFVLGACGGDSSLPVSTGKANIRAMNGIITAPEVDFAIEERSLGTMAYRQITTLSSYDDLNYSFNFDVFYAGDDALTRVASENIDIVKDTDYVLVLTGTLSDASVIIWESGLREFAEAETVFEAKFAHIADSLDTVDYYFAAAGIAPAAGEEVGTLAFGDILLPIDFEAGEYVLTITTSGMPDDILYESPPTVYPAVTQYIVSSFDGDANSTAPFIARAITSGFDSIGGSVTMPDVNYLPTAEFVNGSLTMGTVDIYEDDMFASQIVGNHMYRGVSAELPLSADENPLYYTPTGLIAPVLIEDSISFFGGLRSRVVAYGPVDEYELRAYAPDRRPVETHAKLHLFNAALNFEFLNVYAVEADTTIDEKIPVRIGLESGTVPAPIRLAPGSYDIYITEFTMTEILEGPIRIDVVLGDALGGIIYDTVDPVVLALDFLPNNP